MTGLLTPSHLALLLVVLLLVFGANRLPELGRSLGSGMREFRFSLGGNPDEARRTLAAVPTPAAPADPYAAHRPPAVAPVRAGEVLVPRGEDRDSPLDPAA